MVIHLILVHPSVGRIPEVARLEDLKKVWVLDVSHHVGICELLGMTRWKLVVEKRLQEQKLQGHVQGQMLLEQKL